MRGREEQRQRRGYTLIELMVAMSILAIATGLAASGLDPATRNVRRLTAGDRVASWASEAIRVARAEGRCVRLELVESGPPLAEARVVAVGRRVRRSVAAGGSCFEGSSSAALPLRMEEGGLLPEGFTAQFEPLWLFQPDGRALGPQRAFVRGRPDEPTLFVDLSVLGAPCIGVGTPGTRCE